MAVIIDSKEVATLKELLDASKVEYSVAPLPDCMDIQIGKIAIQRKTMSDLFNAIIDKRVWKQASQLSEMRKGNPDLVPIFVIEGKKLFGGNIQGKRGQISAVLKTLKFSFGIPVHETKSKEATVELILKLSTKESKPFALNYKPKMKTLDEKLQYFVEGIEGVGPVSAKKILSDPLYFQYVQSCYDGIKECIHS